MERIYLNRDWLFWEEYREDIKMKEVEGGTSVIIPHTVKEVPAQYFDESEYQTLSGYQRMVYGEPGWQDKAVVLTFDAAGHKAKVYWNGELLGEHACGYTAFSFDLTGKIRIGENNILAVELDSRETLNQPPFGFVIDYMTFGGIYRDVYLSVADPVYVKRVTDTGLVQSMVEKDMSENAPGCAKKVRFGNGVLASRLALSDAAVTAWEAGTLQIRRQLIEQETGRLFAETAIAKDTAAESSEEKAICPEWELEDLHLWDVDDPYRYRVVTELVLEGRVTDVHEDVIGFRSAEFRSDGFYLNHRKVKIRGLNRHQSYAYVGYAMPESMQREDARILKEELGVNTVRTSHYPQSHYFLDECDRLGLLVVTEIPGWQHIGDDAWKKQAVQNVRDMVLQYQNHPSIILWGVRINESADDDIFYEETNRVCRALDPSRATGGVRAMTAGKNTIIWEDVFTYNDFVHSGANEGCLPKKKATHGSDKPYLITEYNGHMFPTKNADSEEHRVEHMLRHARVMNAAAGEEGVSGAIGWCMFDYNTHKDFGSGDRICYHGVTDLFRNPKMAAYLYRAQSCEETVLQISSSMDIGEHPACNRGDTFIISNADRVRMYKNGRFLKEYDPSTSDYKNLAFGPVRIDDYIGTAIEEDEHWPKKKAQLAKAALNEYSLTGGKITPGLAWKALRLVLFHGFKVADAVPLYQKYIGDWGGASKEYLFEAIRDGHETVTLKRRAVTGVEIWARASHTVLSEDHTYDVAQIRIRAVDQDGNVLPFADLPVKIETEGPVELIGPELIALRGGMSGTYIRTCGKTGEAVVRLSNPQLGTRELRFEVK